MLRIQMDTVLRSPIGFERAWAGMEKEPDRKPRAEVQELTLSSESFEDDGNIPERLAGKQGISPQLAWLNAPEEMSRFIIIMDDPDAQPVVGHTFVHWVAAVPAYRNSIEEGASAGGWTGRPKVLSGDSTSTPYRGPLPPSGTHRYFIAVYAMSGSFNDPEFEDLAASVLANDTSTCTRERFESMYHADIIASAQISGTYTVGLPAH
jgi:Raf kinase inhibitor-like YbhB/YbcL family protein